jgi:hypothetical protein
LGAGSTSERLVEGIGGGRGKVATRKVRYRTEEVGEEVGRRREGTVKRRYRRQARMCVYIGVWCGIGVYLRRECEVKVVQFVKLFS